MIDLKILAIDDNRDNLTALKAVAADRLPGARVLTAPSGPRGLELALDEDPDVILLGTVAPGMDGYEVCRKLKEDKRLEPIPVLALSALRADPDSRAKALEAGAEGFLSMPLDEVEMVAQIRAMAKIKALNRVEGGGREGLAALVAERTRKLEQELSERKRAEEALRENEERLRLALDAAHVGTFDRDIVHNRLTWSRWHQELWGFQPGEFRGTHESFAERIHPDDLAGITATATRCMVTREPFMHEWRVVWPDGSLHWVMGRGEFSFDGSGRAVRMRGVLMEVTDRKRAQEALQLQTAYSRQLFESSPVGIALLGSDGKVVEVNSAFETMFQYSSDELGGHFLHEFLVHESEAQEARRFLVRLQKGLLQRQPATRRRKDGSLVDVIIAGHPIVVGKKPVGLFVIYVDTTEEKRLEEQLRQAQKMEAVGRLAGGVAHDFNNMLSIILGHGEILLRELDNGDPSRGRLEQILEAGRRSARLADQLLAFSRKKTLRAEVVDLNGVIQDLEKMLRRLIGEDLELVLALSKDLSSVMVDPGQIEQVVMNLAVNARDAMPQGGKLIIETADVELDAAYAESHVDVVPGRYVMVSMTDTGFGMDKETLSRVFEPFFTTKEEGKGSGLGLSMVYGIVKQSGGHIWAQSEPGNGSTFKFCLPRTDAKPERKGKRIVAEEFSGVGKRVLLVEDEPALSEVIGEILLKSGFQVSVAANGDEALRLVEEGGPRPDLVVTDVVMPGMSGPVLAERLRKTLPDLRVLFMSGYTHDSIAGHDLPDWPTPLIEKPFSADDLIEKIKEVLRAGKGEFP